MDEELRKRLEYEEQFFGMSSKFFADCFKKLILDELDSKINMFVEDFKGKLLEQAKNPDTFELALQKMKEDMTAQYRIALDRASPEIESKISNFINIPPNVLLKEDLPVSEGINGNVSEIKKEIENLKGKFCSLLYLKQKMLEELDEAESAIVLMEHVIKDEKINFNVLPVEEISALAKENNNHLNCES